MAYDKIKGVARRVVENLSLVGPGDFELEGRDSLLTVLCQSPILVSSAKLTEIAVADFRAEFDKYLASLECSSLENFEALRDFYIDRDKCAAYPPSK